jgi:ABC-type amino acid transport substrate-binding protein
MAADSQRTGTGHFRTGLSAVRHDGQRSRLRRFTADYAGLLEQASGLPVRVQRFASREAALRALKAGQVDMLGTANGFEASDADILLSTPYAIDQPVLVTRETKPARSPRAWPVCA